MYPDVILMTESMAYLHEFETQRLEQDDTIGIEIEIPPTADMVRQKRTATTTRSIKTRQRSSRQSFETVQNENDLPDDTIEHLNFVPVPSDASPTTLTPPTVQKRRSINDVLKKDSPFLEQTILSTDHDEKKSSNTNTTYIS